ncbi:MAG: thioredoxin fold domain-containing protein [Armatimonadetes bacterium]|jgi:thioredoxin-related protein|nr:thioredoxin fold domain-containing protein [Armatimonadota bacterium]
MRRMRWIAPLAVAGLLLATAARAEQLPWRTDVKEALAEGTRADRLVMLSFTDTDCEWCDRMDSETLSNADVVKACERVIPVRVDVNTAPELARQYGIEGVPSFIFVEGSGDEVGRIVGFLPAPIFLDRLQQVLDDQQKVVDLRKQVSENPNDYEAKANLARIYIERRQGDLAAPLVDALAALPKDDAPADMAEMLLGTGIAYGSRGNNDRALVYLEKVIQGYPGTEEAEWAQFFTGLALGLKGEREAAIQQLEKVIATVKSEVVRERARMLLERFREEPAPPSL